VKTHPHISVIIPTYRHAAYVLQTLESVFAQTFQDFEVIVVNDGSPDDTAEVLRPLAATGRIRYFEQENAGQASARNRGINEARGEYIALVDDDDLWPPDKLEWQMSAFQNNPGAVLVYGYAARVGGSAMHSPPIHLAPSGNVLDHFVGGTWISSPGQTLIHAGTLKKIGGFDPRVWGADDWDLYIRLAQAGKFQFINRCALKYRVHAGNASRNWWRMYRNSRKVVLKNFRFSLKPVPFRRWRASRKCMAKLTSASLVRGIHGMNRDSLWSALGLCAATFYVHPGGLLRRSHWQALAEALRVAASRPQKKAGGVQLPACTH
jgi:glycosyltransferase involved in cell wall biosynthesis